MNKVFHWAFCPSNNKFWNIVNLSTWINVKNFSKCVEESYEQSTFQEAQTLV